MAKTGSIKITQDSQSVANNTSTITVRGIITTSGESYRGSHRSGSYSIYQGSKLISSGTFTSGAPANTTTTLFTKTLTVTHDDNGKSSAITASYNYDSGWCTGTGSLSLSTISVGSSFGAITGNTLGSPMTVNITSKNSAYTHQIWYKLGSSEWDNLGKGFTTSVEFTPDIELCSQIPNATSGSLQLCIRTFNGDARVGSDVYKNVTVYVPDDVKPSCTVEVVDLFEPKKDYGGFVQGFSKIQVTVTPATLYGATITKYNTTACGLSYTTASFETDIIKEAGVFPIKSTVTDSRKRSGSATVEKTVLAYTKPVISALAVRRCDADGTENDKGDYAKVTFSAAVTSLNDRNAAVYVVKYKKTSEASYPESQIITLADYANVYSVEDADYIFAADSGSSYNVELSVSDDFDESTEKTSVSTGFTLMHWLASGLGMAVGKVAELTDVFDIAFKTRFMGGILLVAPIDGTDLDTLRTPNVFRLFSARTYSNAPESAVGAILKVMGDETSTVQEFAVISKARPRTYQRSYVDGSWGEWIKMNTLNYSETEILTNETMYGEPVYMRMVQVPLGAAGMIEHAHGIPIASMYDYYWVDLGQSFVMGDSGTHYPFTNGLYRLDVAVHTKNVRIKTYDNWTGYVGHVCVKYVK